MKISLNNITKDFGANRILDNFSCTFGHGQTTVIMGKSGIGKTTLLRIAAGLDKDYSGEITPKKYTVSVVFQEPRLFPGATVLENLLAVADKKRSVELLDKMGISKDAFSLFPDEISGGMARRVSLARGLLFDADVYLIDEPFFGLDKENAENIADIIKSYMQNKTCVIVTHNRDFAEMLADNIINLKKS